jgi:hypothetical protein
MNGAMIFDAIKGAEGILTGRDAEENGGMTRFGRATRRGNGDGRKGVLENGGSSSFSDSSSEEPAAGGCGFRWRVEGSSGPRIGREWVEVDCRVKRMGMSLSRVASR